MLAGHLVHLGVAVAGQVHQAPLLVQLEEVQQLGAARGLGGARQGALAGEAVDGAGFAGVGAAGEGHLEARVRGALFHVLGAFQEAGLVEKALGRILGHYRSLSERGQRIPAPLIRHMTGANL